MNVSTRVSLWKSNAQRCLYCGEIVTYRDLEIDHVIPDSTVETELEKLRARLDLDVSFSLDDTHNLVPTHHDCNRKKRATQFNESTLRYYLGIWGEKQETIKQEQAKFERAAERDDLLARLTHQVENGAISADEIGALVQSFKQPKYASEPSPMVLSFGKPWEDVESVSEEERKLVEKLRRKFRRPLVPAEPSSFTGETLSVRLAVWNLDVDKIEVLDLGGWEVLEVEAAAQIYGNDAARALGEAITETYDIFYAERHGCPQCGGNVVMRGMASESGELAIATCEQCGWEDYHS